MVFPYEWLISYEELNQGPVQCRNFYSSLKKKKPSRKEYEKKFRKDFYKRGCVNIHDWSREYNIVYVELFFEAVGKTRHQYFPDKLDMLKDAVSIPGIYRFNKKVLNDSLFGFVVGEIAEVPEYMKKYREETGRKENRNGKKLLGLMKADKILLYTPLLKWYIKHGLKLTAYHKHKYKAGRPFD